MGPLTSDMNRYQCRRFIISLHLFRMWFWLKTLFSVSGTIKSISSDVQLSLYPYLHVNCYCLFISINKMLCLILCQPTKEQRANRITSRHNHHPNLGVMPTPPHVNFMEGPACQHSKSPTKINPPNSSTAPSRNNKR